MVALNLHDERGFTLIELLAVMTLALVVLAATLVTFTTLSTAAHDNNVRLETTEEAREALDAQARQLRNLAKRLNNTAVLDTVAPYDLIFQTSDPSRTWVRYCLDTVHAPATTSQARLWTQERALLSAAASPVTRGDAHRLPVGLDGVDEHAGRRRAPDQPPRRAGPASVPVPLHVGHDLHVGVRRRTTRSSTSARSRSSTPTVTVPCPSCAWRAGSTCATRTRRRSRASSRRRRRRRSTVVLNASASTDFEGRTLNYFWFVGSRPAIAAIDCANPAITGSGPLRSLWGASGFAGESITLSYTFTPAERLLGPRANVGLVVCDPGDRYGTAGITSPIPVQIPS